MTTSTCLGDWIYDIPKAKTEIKTFSPKLGASIFGAGASIAATASTEDESSPVVASHATDTVFTNVCHAIVDQNIAADGLLLVVDEFDQIKDPAGMAGLLKSLATNVPKVKFCLVGVARDIQNLMKEHESTDRLFAGGIVNLPPMSSEELSEIIRIAEHSVGDNIRFSEQATTRLVQLAQGHPYMVHLVGKYALRSAYQEGVFDIPDTAIEQALRSIAERPSRSGTGGSI